jgi:hypothetical protein
MAHNAIIGFAGMIGSIGCMHCAWKNYLFAWQEMYEGTKDLAAFYLRQWKSMMCGFGMLSLA